ncbi:MAG: hypothetical protein ACKODX_00330 [Gemmata sp.]|jgi:uncharacterized membrane protein
MLAILAQANGGDEAAGLFTCGVCMMFALGVMVVALIPQIFFLLTQQRALARCSARNRTQEPGMVWLAIIPFVGFVWIFINVIRIAESLRYEYRDRGLHARGEDYGHGIGIAYCCLAVGGIIPYIGVLLGIAAFVCWIIYWIKIANLSGQLEGDGSARYDDWDAGDEDDEDRRPRRRSARGGEEDDSGDRRKPWERRD